MFHRVSYCYSHSCNTQKDCKWQHIAKDNDWSLQKHYQTLSAVQVTNWQSLPFVSIYLSHHPKKLPWVLGS